MNNDIGSKVKKSTKQLAQQSAKQVAREPLEVIKTAGRQVAGAEKKEEVKKPSDKTSVPEKARDITPEKKRKIEKKGENLFQAYQSELEDIRKQEIFKDIQRRIQNGEDVSLIDIPGLTREQREVLSAQKKALKLREEEEEKKKEDDQPVEPSTKIKRKMFTGVKGKLEKLKRKTETRLPPSG